MRRVIVPHRLAIPTSVRAAPPSSRSVEREGGGNRCRLCLRRLVDALSDISESYCGGVRRKSIRFGEGQPRENEKKEERKGGVPRRDREMCTAFEMRRTCHCGFVAGDDSLEQSG